MFAHGLTFGGHPVAVRGVANLDVFAREDRRAVRSNDDASRSTWKAQTSDRGRSPRDGYFYGTVVRQVTRRRSTSRVRAAARGPYQALFEGALLPADERGTPSCSCPRADRRQAEFDEMERVLRSVLTEEESALSGRRTQADPADARERTFSNGPVGAIPTPADREPRHTPTAPVRAARRLCPRGDRCWCTGRRQRLFRRCPAEPGC